ncbi:MAG TPA: family 16 glycoside hydrolase [Phycisphaerae bacterium]|nr:family 16 glycoside hydrolase [Phycisphaerae bacterium]
MTLLAVVVLSATVLAASGEAGENDGWTSLFNGKNLDGWVVKWRPEDKDKIGCWKVVDGTIIHIVTAHAPRSAARLSRRSKK